MRWNLNNLYKSFDSPEFIKDFEDFQKDILTIQDWAENNLRDTENAEKKIEEYIKFLSSFEKYFNMLHYSDLILSVDSTNERAMKTVDSLENILTEMEKPSVMFKNFLKNLDVLPDGSSIIREHEFYLRELLDSVQYMLSEEEEVIIKKMQNTGSSSFTKLQEQLTSTLLVDINLCGEDKKLPLAQIRALAEDTDRYVRKSAYYAELKAYEKIDKPVAFALNSIKGEVLNTSKQRGYKSPLEMTLLHSRMKKETLDALLSAIKDCLPVFRNYLKKKASVLGYKNGLPFYELFTPIGTVELHFSFDEAKEFIIKNFSAFSENLGNFARRAFDEQWIDAEIREGKRGGAFCANLHFIKESRIMANFSGSFGDVITLAHELGHAYHGDCLNDETYLNSDYPMPIAETASTLCETIVIKAALKTASPEEQKVILENELQNVTQVTVDILSRFIFEDGLFRKREEGPLSVAELKQAMLDAQLETYGDGLDPEALHPYMWLCKPHYYSADFNYYNFPYAYGMLFAKGLYSIYLEKGGEFVTLYDKMLRATGRNNLEDVAALAGIDVTKKDFWLASLRLIENDMQKL